MKATYNNLRDGERERMMYCIKCGGEYSADKSDYFMVRGDHKFRCCNCIMDVVVKQTTHCLVI